MAINFPNSPSDGQQLTEGSVTYTYNATKGYWESTESSSASSSSTTVVANMTALIALTGMSDGDQALVQATNKLYMYSGTGWYLIATIQNDAPSAITGVSGTYELAIDGTATTITAASTDPEGFPLTWSYSTSGLGSIATISNTDNVFTITPSTTEADAGAFTLTINATDGINGAVSTTTNLTLDFIVIVTNSNYTTLLATAVDTSDNNNITDTSSNNHSITVNGDAHAGTFSPYRSGGYSLKFNGSNSRVGIQSSDVQIGTSAFTMEFWLYSRAHSGSISSKYSASNSHGYFLISTTSSEGFRCRTRSSGGTQKYVNSGSGSYNLNQWNHCIFQRDANGNLTSYLNGTKYTGENDGSTNLSATELGLGVFNYIGYEGWLDGYIRDFKLTIGTSALRTASTITVPTEPLASDSNTTVFLGHSPYLVDGSTNSNSIVSTQQLKISPFSPYDYLEYAAADHGGSVYFDGTGDYLSISNQEISGDLTYEGWFYQTIPLTGVYQTLISSSTYASGVPFRVYTNGTDIQVWTSGSGGAEITEPVKPYTWFHIAMVRYSGTWTLYVNGKSVGTTTVGGTYDFASTTGWSVGGSQTGSYPFTGYASDVRLTNSAVYSSNFTPATAPISSSGSVLHIKGTDASIIDNSHGANLKLVGNTTGSTTQAKFSNTKSMYFDGSGDYIDATQNWIQLRTSDFTVETWFYPTATPSNHEGIFCYGAHGSGNYLQLLYQTNRLIRYDIYADVGGGSTSNLSTTAISLNTWNHIALCRSGGNIRLYVNGTQEHTEANSSDLNFTQATTGYETIAVIGNRTGLSGYELNSAYLQDLRVTKGLARYTAADETGNIPTEPLKG